jgi:hypothetical protein
MAAQPGPVEMTPVLSAARGISPWTVVRLVYHSLSHTWDMLLARPEPSPQPLLPLAPEPVAE